MTKIITLKNEDTLLMEKLKDAKEIISKKGLVAFPTETVYGLGANAFEEEAVKKIFTAKGRDSDNPLIVHIADKKDLGLITKNIPKDALILMDAFWPGPLTLILPKSDKIPPVTSAGLDTIGVRMPRHPVALALLSLTGPLSAPSANLSGKPSPTRYEHVFDDLKDKVDIIIDAMGGELGIESTVFHVEKRAILRPGSITQEMIEDVIGKISLDPYLENQRDYIQKGMDIKKVDKPLAPGQKYKHYAPIAESFVVMRGQILDIVKDIQDKSKIGVLATDETISQYKHIPDMHVLSMGSEKNSYADLFHRLRAFDKLGVTTIYIEGIEKSGVGFSVMDRIIKAVSYKIIR